MITLSIREPRLEDESAFLTAMVDSQSLHHPWIKAPNTSEEFKEYITHYQRPDQKSYLLCNGSGNITGVINISEIVRGSFQSAYLGFYAVRQFANQGYMSAGLKLVIEKAFTDLKLHRLEANIQPDNLRSINLVKSNGFRKEGFSLHYLFINGEWRNHERWAMTLEDWEKM